MRIIAGQFKGQTIKTAPGDTSRPTLSRIRESLFHILMPDIPEARFLDLYAGTGSVGLEAYSQGAQSVDFVEMDRTVGKVLGENIGKFNARHKQLALIAGDAREVVPRLLAQHREYDIIFLDPPYDPEIIAAWAQDNQLSSMLAPDGLLILQHSRKISVSKDWAGCALVKARTYGKTSLAFFKKQA